MFSTELPLPVLDPILVRALEEDVGAGDVTTESCVLEDARATANGVARKEVVACGIPVAARVFALVDPSLRFETKVADGTKAAAGTVLWTVSGSARALLMAERVSLNLAQRMSGIATATRRYVDALPKDSKTRITDTRKTWDPLESTCRHASLSIL